MGHRPESWHLLLLRQVQDERVNSDREVTMNPSPPATYKQVPDALGHFGPYGGKFVPETLMAALAELEEAYQAAKENPEFQAELQRWHKHYTGRPTPLYHAP